MPTFVAFTRISLSPILLYNAFLSAISQTCILHSGANSNIFFAIFSSFSKFAPFRLNTWISEAPSSASCTKIAVPAPPPPISVIVLSFTETPCSARFFTNPTPSVLCPISFPFSFTTVLEAPMICAAGDNSSTCLATSILHGIVTLKPRILRSLAASRNSPTWSSFISNAM